MRTRFISVLTLLLTAGSLLASEPVPRGDIFDPLFADPKELRSLASCLYTESDDYKTAIALVGFSERWGIYRWKGKHANEGWQVGITGGVFAFFDLHTISKDLINADYLVGFPLSWRMGKTSTRFRVYHQSSHLGDEYLIGQHPTRINLSFESMEWLFSRDLGRLRVYGGGEWIFDRHPDDLDPWVPHWGAEFRAPLSLKHLNRERKAQWVTAMDFKVTDGPDNNIGWNTKTGLEFGPLKTSDMNARRWSLNWTFYRGPSPYGQFIHRNVTTTGIEFQILR